MLLRGFSKRRVASAVRPGTARLAGAALRLRRTLSSLAASAASAAKAPPGDDLPSLGSLLAQQNAPAGPMPYAGFPTALRRTWGLGG